MSNNDMAVRDHRGFFECHADKKGWDFAQANTHTKVTFGQEGENKGHIFKAYSQAVIKEGIGEFLPALLVTVANVCRDILATGIGIKNVITEHDKPALMNLAKRVSDLTVGSVANVAAVFIGVVAPFVRDYALAMRFAAADAPNAGLQDQITSKEEKITSLGKKIADESANLEKLSADTEKNADKIAALEKSVKANKQELASSKAILSEMQTQLAAGSERAAASKSADTKPAAKEGEECKKDDLKSKDSELRAEIAALTKEIEEATKLLDTQNKTVTSQNTQVNKATRANAEAQKEFDTAKAKLDNLKKELARAENKAANVKLLNEKVVKGGDLSGEAKSAEAVAVALGTEIETTVKPKLAAAEKELEAAAIVFDTTKAELDSAREALHAAREAKVELQNTLAKNQKEVAEIKEQIQVIEEELSAYSALDSTLSKVILDQAARIVKEADLVTLMQKENAYFHQKSLLSQFETSMKDMEDKHKELEKAVDEKNIAHDNFISEIENIRDSIRSIQVFDEVDFRDALNNDRTEKQDLLSQLQTDRADLETAANADGADDAAKKALADHDKQIAAAQQALDNVPDTEKAVADEKAKIELQITKLKEKIASNETTMKTLREESYQMQREGENLLQDLQRTASMYQQSYDHIHFYDPMGGEKYFADLKKALTEEVAHLNKEHVRIVANHGSIEKIIIDDEKTKAAQDKLNDLTAKLKTFANDEIALNNAENAVSDARTKASDLGRAHGAAIKAQRECLKKYEAALTSLNEKEAEHAKAKQELKIASAALKHKDNLPQVEKAVKQADVAVNTAKSNVVEAEKDLAQKQSSLDAAAKVLADAQAVAQTAKAAYDATNAKIVGLNADKTDAEKRRTETKAVIKEAVAA